jgi:hypothetical protein
VSRAVIPIVSLALILRSRCKWRLEGTSRVHRTLLRDAASRLLLRMRAMGLEAEWPGPIPGSCPETAMTGERSWERR